MQLVGLLSVLRTYSLFCSQLGSQSSWSRSPGSKKGREPEPGGLPGEGEPQPGFKDQKHSGLLLLDS